MKVQERSLGKVSVVQIALAARSQSSCVAERAEWAIGTAERILEIGRRWPITPVDITSVLLVSTSSLCPLVLCGVLSGEDLKQASTA